MTPWDSDKERLQLEEALKNRSLEFSAAYLAVRDLHSFVQSAPERVRAETLRAIQDLLQGREHAAQKQALVLYKEAAGVLASLAACGRLPIARQAVDTLQCLVSTAKGPVLRAAAEAMGSLPLRVEGPTLRADPEQSPPCMQWEDLLRYSGGQSAGPPRAVGRSLVTPLNGHLLVIKCACTQDAPERMQQEPLWMDHLRSGSYAFPLRFDIPTPLRVGDGYLFRLKDAPFCSARALHPNRYAVGFVAHRDYFRYINADRNGLDAEGFKDALRRNALLLGQLTGSGIVHSAPIPLFHNRVQRHRRPDLGVYEWPRGGRLDQWLSSCHYPNVGLTGIRDFEHFMAFRGPSTKLYQHIGTHLLSLLLVAGSYFRNQDPQRVGLDQGGHPVDARELFHKATLEEVIQGSLAGYYKGFVGEAFPHHRMAFDFSILADRMIDEMGIDRHMEEILRMADQVQMTDGEFRRFLLDRGLTEEAAAAHRRGIEDIVIHTGPHLGRFNDRISLPELTDFVARASALCIAGKFLKTQ